MVPAGYGLWGMIHSHPCHKERDKDGAPECCTPDREKTCVSGREKNKFVVAATSLLLWLPGVVGGVGEGGFAFGGDLEGELYGVAVEFGVVG